MASYLDTRPSSHAESAMMKHVAVHTSDHRLSDKHPSSHRWRQERTAALFTRLPIWLTTFVVCFAICIALLLSITLPRRVLVVQLAALTDHLGGRPTNGPTVGCLTIRHAVEVPV